MVAHRDQILEQFELFRGGTGGLDSWLSAETPERVFIALRDLENQPLTRSGFNQLLTLSHEAPVSEAFFNYYWLSAPNLHPYNVKKIPCFDERFCDDSSVSVRSLDQLYWGLYRFYVDALLYLGIIADFRQTA